MATDALRVKITRLINGMELPLPAYGSDGAAGFDFCAAPTSPIRIPAGGRALVPTGFAVAVPPGYEMQIRPRSGMALKHGITIANTPGTIDSDYRGEIGLIVLNAGPNDFTVTHGMRLAQGVVAPVTRIEWDEVTDLDDTARGVGGFGSTGTHSEGGART